MKMQLSPFFGVEMGKERLEKGVGGKGMLGK